jgi:hypothetical protein
VGITVHFALLLAPYLLIARLVTQAYRDYDTMLLPARAAAEEQR